MLTTEAKKSGIDYIMSFYGRHSELSYKDWFRHGKGRKRIGMNRTDAKKAIDALSKPLNWTDIASFEREMVRDYVLHTQENKPLEQLEWGNMIRQHIPAVH